jgi:pimeloyl-ACP methyl ester carboxylesterase
LDFGQKPCACNLAVVLVERIGSGPRVVLVHGSVTGPGTWSRQRPLAERWTLELVTRPGFWPLEPVPRVDFAAEAPLVGEALGEGAHLVGHSYGGVVSLLAAAARPEAVRSLTVVEPPALGVARGHPAADAMIARVEALWAEGTPEPRAFLEEFLRTVGSAVPLPEELPPALQRGAELLLVERGPHEARIPFEALRAGGFPVLVVSGGHSPAFDAVCDVVERELSAERAVLPGAGHAAPGAPGFNEVLERFLLGAEARLGS